MSLILTLTGMSTSGKSKLAHALEDTGDFIETVSVTTRKPRAGEVDGVHYHFVDQKTFDQYVEQGKMLEHVRSHNACYGTPSFEVERIQRAGCSVVSVLEPEGVSSIHKLAVPKEWNIRSAFVQVDPLVLYERFFTRIERNLAAGQPLNADEEAKRLHVMLSQERGWLDTRPWDVILNNLHLPGRMEFAIDGLRAMHRSSESFKPTPSDLSRPNILPCLSRESLATLIEEQVSKPGALEDFAVSVMAPLSKMRVHDESNCAPG